MLSIAFCFFASKLEIEYASSLPLQLVLYFNVFYSIVWAIGTAFIWPLLVATTAQDSAIWSILIIFAFVMMLIFEVIRLYLAYVGNLCERVPELTGFWLLTLMVEIPLSTFLLIIVWFPVVVSGTLDPRLIYFIPMQFVLELIHALFAYLEIGLGFFALRILARYQISRFHYKQFDAFESNLNRVTNADLESDEWLLNLDKNNSFPLKEIQKVRF